MAVGKERYYEHIKIGDLIDNGYLACMVSILVVVVDEVITLSTVGSQEHQQSSPHTCGGVSCDCLSSQKNGRGWLQKQEQAGLVLCFSATELLLNQ